MALNIKNAEVERLVSEISKITGETKTEAIRKALLERRKHIYELPIRPKEERVRLFLSERIWPLIPPQQKGKVPLKEELESILGYKEEGI